MRRVLVALTLTVAALALPSSGRAAARVSSPRLARSHQQHRGAPPAGLDAAINRTLGSTTKSPVQQPLQQELGAGIAAANSYFGYSVAVSGDGKTALVGAPYPPSNTGAACVFVWNGSIWILQQTLTAADGAAGDNFGLSVALGGGGNSALIGAQGKNSSKGAAYLFTRNGTSWGQAHEFTASDEVANDGFGGSVAVNGNSNEVLIGAQGKNSNTGAAYVFARSKSIVATWGQVKLTASDGATGDKFGSSVALNSIGGTALVGANRNNSFTGAAYVFTLSAGSWSQQQKLTATDGTSGDGFGDSVAVSSNGNSILIGASGKNSNIGAAYVFVSNGTSWTQQQELTASGGTTGDEFGVSVSVSSDGNTALVGAPVQNIGTGAAYVFSWDGSAWNQQSVLTASGGTKEAQFGSSVALSGDGNVGFVGAPQAAIPAGRAYIFILHPMEPLTAVSIQQFQLTGSDGVTWQALVTSDLPGPPGVSLALTVTPRVASQAIVSGNADLWTSSTGYNQDLGISISGGSYPTTTGQPEAWKESGGFAGTNSPNAAYVQAVVPLAAGTTYTITLVWKTNKSDLGTIWAGAGPIAGNFSPTSLTALLEPTANAAVSSVVSTQQYTLTGSDGSAWQNLGSALSTTVTPSVDSDAILSGNADLWTSFAGYNQDLGIWISGGSFGTGQLVAWKESGGFAGTNSPNAAYVQMVQQLTAGTTYTITLVWKTNKSDPGTIWAGAGPIGGKFSPTRLTALLQPHAGNTVPSVVSTQQYTLAKSDGTTWTTMDSLALGTTVTGSATSPLAIVSGNADLWTSSTGYNQDLGIWISGGSYGTGQVVAWKESGGFAGTFSPNAAFVETVLPLDPGVPYTIKLVWKTNKADPGTIYAAAGNAGNFSPTRLTVLIPPAL